MKRLLLLTILFVGCGVPSGQKPLDLAPKWKITVWSGGSIIREYKTQSYQHYSSSDIFSFRNYEDGKWTVVSGTVLVEEL